MVVGLVALAVGGAVRLAGALLHHRAAVRAGAVPSAYGVTLKPYDVVGARQPRWSAGALARARAAIAPFANAAGMPARSGVAVIAGDGTVLYARNAAALLVPASTMKLLVGSAAYFGLGRDARLQTRLVATAPPDARGVVHGDLRLVGGGDPLLASADLQAAAESLVQRGVRAVDGDLVVDATAFAGAEQNPTWLPDDLEYDFAAGASPVSLDQGVVQIDVTPTTPGLPAKIALEPPNGAVRLTGGAITTSATMSLSIERAADGRGLVISGGIPAGPEQRFWRTVVDQPAYVGDVFARMLRSRGIALGGIRIADHPTAGGTQLWQHDSEPIGSLVREMFFASNNHTAEQLLRIIGRSIAARGTVASGARAERRLFAAAGVRLEGARIVDGSGLSLKNRIDAMALARILALDLSARDGSAFVHELPRVGFEGTVRYRSLGQGAGRVFAKDGYEDGASSLAGYVVTRHHGVVTFAVIADDWDSLDRVWTIEDEMLDRISTL